MFMSLLVSAGVWLLKRSSTRLLQSIGGVLEGATDSIGKVALAQVQAEITARQAAKEVRLAMVGFPEIRLLTFIVGLCVVSHFAAVSLDTIFKFGWKIPAYPAPMDEWEGYIILWFFGIQPLAKSGIAAVIQAFKGRK